MQREAVQKGAVSSGAAPTWRARGPHTAGGPTLGLRRMKHARGGGYLTEGARPPLETRQPATESVREDPEKEWDSQAPG